VSEFVARALWEYLQLAFIALALMNIALFVLDVAMPIKRRKQLSDWAMRSRRLW
jgi:hypothetical protein